MNDLKKLAEPLEISDIDFRIKSITTTGYAVILAYKDARVDQRRLDEVVGAENWQKDYKVINNNLFCGIGIKCGNEWVWKWDVGIESNKEKEKGEASDAQKRAGFAWGIGRELYDYPFIGIQLNKDEYGIEGGKAKQAASLRLNSWIWESSFDNGKLLSLKATDTRGVRRFSYDVKQKNSQNIKSQDKETRAKEHIQQSKTVEELKKAQTYIDSLPLNHELRKIYSDKLFKIQ